MSKNNWINTEDKMPLINEIIYYKGNLRGQEGRHMGNGFIELPNHRIDQFDEWVPKNIGFVTIRVPHIENHSIKCEAKGKVIGDEFKGEYKYKGMTFGINLPLQSL